MDVSRDMSAPVAAVWERFALTRHWPSWGPSVRAVEPADARVHAGLTGTVTTAVGVRLPFEITEVLAQQSWSWRVAGVSATDHVVVPTDGGCRVTIRVPWWAPAYAPICALGLRRLAEGVEHPGDTMP